MQSQTFNGRSVKHVSISFKEILPLGSNIHSRHQCQSMTSENFNFMPNRQSRPKFVYLSINSLMKENNQIFTERGSTSRRHKLKQLSLGYKLNKEALS